ncbi:uncharacterized protein LOC131246469 [Magnolia sinica]|uniref:uncharacterized protein LOC131246469 n=1 Tax=Magnolia sinica TaxID=86752 RepID=UPI002658860A|nr:uncharacterized protein LOC131246469 [Magnolia sinica]
MAFSGPQGGLSQGDHLSPYLFVIIREALSKILYKGEENGLISGFKVFENKIQASHDTLLFCDAYTDFMNNLVKILVYSKVISRLKINVANSEMLGVHVFDEELSQLVNVFVCKKCLFPSSYLGLPFCIEKPAKRLWEGVVKRIKRKLAS